MKRNGYVYILTNRPNGVLYTGVTNDLIRRVSEHKNHCMEGFTKKYNLKNLVYFETFNIVPDAMQREKQIKGWTRRKKILLIESKNPGWRDLYWTLL